MIVMKNLTKAFPNEVTAADGISLHIAKGETVGIIGANGAGKTTIIKLICGLYTPTSGYVRVFGEEPFFGTTNQHNIGLVTGQVITDGYNYHFGHSTSMLDDELSLELNFELIGNIYKIPKAVCKNRISEILRQFDLQKIVHYRVNQLSLGQRMKSELAAALLIKPQLLILDEPFIGVDIAAKETIRRVLSRIAKERDTTVILTTHNVEEIERVCSRVLFLDNGKLVYNGSFDRLKRSHIGLNSMKVTFEKMPPDLRDFPINRYIITENNLKLYYDSSVVSSKDISNYLLSQGEVYDMLIEKPTVEEIIRELYKEENNVRNNH